HARDPRSTDAVFVGFAGGGLVVALTQDVGNAEHGENQPDDRDKMDSQRPQIHGSVTKPYLWWRVNGRLHVFSQAFLYKVRDDGRDGAAAIWRRKLCSFRGC